MTGNSLNMLNFKMLQLRKTTFLKHLSSICFKEQAEASYTQGFYQTTASISVITEKQFNKFSNPI
jgi:hypothetical protein